MLDSWSKCEFQLHQSSKLRRTRLENLDLGVKVTFKQVTPKEFVKRMKKSGLPGHIALAATELCQALVVEDRILGDMSVVSGKTVSTCTSEMRI